LPSPIPLYDVRQDHAGIEDDYCRALRGTIERGRFVLGPEVERFETLFARTLGVAHCVGVNSGTDAIILALKGLGIGPGDEVITTPFTFIATAEAIVRAGARPVFADVEPGSLCLSPDASAAAITPRTRAVLTVHIFGHCGDFGGLIDLCRARGIHLVEDACQAVGSIWLGRHLGTVGAAGAFSFYPTKNLSALGDAGAVVTNDPDLAAGIRCLRSHGLGADGRQRQFGHNSRLDELQAAFLNLRLGRLEAENNRRRELARRYDENLEQLVGSVRGSPDCRSNYHQYGIRSPRRDDLRRFLNDRGIGTGLYYAAPVHRQPALAYAGPALPEAEAACAEVLALPIRPSLADTEQDDIIGAISEFRRPK